MDGKRQEIGVSAPLRAALFRALAATHGDPTSYYGRLQRLIAQYHRVSPEAVYLGSSSLQLRATLASLNLSQTILSTLFPDQSPRAHSSELILLGTFDPAISVAGVPFAYLVADVLIIRQLEQQFPPMTPSVFVVEIVAELLGSESGALLAAQPEQQPTRAKSIMVQGLSSDAGKSIIAAALCRIMVQDGYRVAPFKAQNMALNSAVTPEGGEIGRAQAVQAQACKIDPDTRMNPLLLKPHREMGAQVILRGKAVGYHTARDFYTSKERFKSAICEAYDALAQEYEVIVLEGAGSPAEINLKENDLVNMAMAAYAESPVLLVGDIDRGGVYASFLGTYHTFDLWERELVLGFVVNRFRGDARQLVTAHAYLEKCTTKPVLGVVPFIPHLAIPDEDSVALDAWARKGNEVADLDVAILWLPHISNFTDFAPLGFEPDVSLRLVRLAEELGSPDLIIIPGSKSVVSDLAFLRHQGFEPLLSAQVAQGARVVAVCGGLQMCGMQIGDPYALESKEKITEGFGFLPLFTTMGKEKTLTIEQQVTTPLNHYVRGYEIHHGVTESGDCAVAFRRNDGTPIGYSKGKIWTCYLHGLFDDDLFRWAFVEMLRQEKGLAPLPDPRPSYDVDKALDRLAEVVRGAIDMDALYHAMGLKKKEIIVTKDRV